jgi:hypothetical protein
LKYSMIIMIGMWHSCNFVGIFRFVLPV